MPQIAEWQSRGLESVYPFRIHGCDSLQNQREPPDHYRKAAYVVLGINMDGYKEILGIWIGENESSKFWLICPE